MDLIAGLPSDTVEGFQKTLDTALFLQPENLTVHTLSLKRSSTLTIQGEILSVYDNPAAEMMDYALSRTEQAGYAPYYLYRQKIRWEIWRISDLPKADGLDYTMSILWKKRIPY